jgi:hypothetical protein
MFKVSFKETPKQPSKAITKVGLTTTVILRGVIKLPPFWKHMPNDIVEWIGKARKVECYENIVDNTLIIYSTGMSKCRPDDKYDSLVGERLAESRAKTHIYCFFYDLTYKLYNYYSNILFGSEATVSVGAPGSLERAMYKYEKLYRREIEHQEEIITSKSNG